MCIVKITKATASAASHIYALSWKVAYKNIVPDDYLDNLSLERWTPFLEKSEFSGYLLKVNDEFVATSSIASARDETMDGYGEIISIYVLPKHFNKGHGKALLSFVVDELKKQNFNKVYLWVLEDNKTARTFYEKNGFRHNGDVTTVEIGGKELAELRYVRDI